MSTRTDFDKTMKTLGFITHSCLSFGDYDNSSAIERANVQCLKEDDHYKDTYEEPSHDVIDIGVYDRATSTWSPYKPDDDTTMLILYGGYNHEEAWIKDDEHGQDIIKGLEEYPCIDDAAVSNVEIEMEIEAFGSWIGDDIARELSKLEDDDETRDKWDALLHGLDATPEAVAGLKLERRAGPVQPPDTETMSGAMTLYHEACEATNTDGHCESGGSWYVQIERLVPYIAKKLQEQY